MTTKRSQNKKNPTGWCSSSGSSISDLLSVGYRCVPVDDMAFGVEEG